MNPEPDRCRPALLVDPEPGRCRPALLVDLEPGRCRPGLLVDPEAGRYCRGPVGESGTRPLPPWAYWWTRSPTAAALPLLVDLEPGRYRRGPDGPVHRATIPRPAGLPGPKVVCMFPGKRIAHGPCH